MLIIISLVLWIFAGLVVAAAAAGRGRNGLGWFIYGFLIWPVALVHVLVLPKTDARLAHEAKLTARAHGLVPAVDTQRVPCPFCAERILPNARLCPHCRSDLTTSDALKLRPLMAPPEAEILPRDVPILGTVLATDGLAGERSRKPGSVSWMTWCMFILGSLLLLAVAYGLRPR